MKPEKSLYVFLFFLLLIPFLSNGQYVVKKVAGDATNTAQDGFYYALPQTVFKIELTVEQIKKIPGPLADYATNYLGVNDYIRYSGNSVQLINAEVTPLSEADPDQYYYVQFPAEKSKEEKATSFLLSEQGTLLGFGMEGGTQFDTETTDIEQTFILMEGDEDFSYFADYNRMKKIDTIVRKISIDTVTINRFLFKTSWVDKSNEEKANEAARRISEIREARFHLISGYQEVNYGESIMYMDKKLEALEQESLELFLGKEVKTTRQVTVYYVPQKEKLRDVIYNDPDGNSIEIVLQPAGTTAGLPETPLEKPDNIYYRVPQTAVVNIIQKGTTYYTSSIPVCQFGVPATAPLNRTRLLFDQQTGNLRNIIRE